MNVFYRFFILKLFFICLFFFYQAQAQNKQIKQKPVSQNLQLEPLSFLQKDTFYKQIPVYKKNVLIYSKDFQHIIPQIAQDIRQIYKSFDKIFFTNSYLNADAIILTSNYNQQAQAFAYTYPYPSIVIRPSLSFEFMDRYSIFNWTRTTLIHEITHVYQRPLYLKLPSIFLKMLPSLAYKNFLFPVFAMEGGAVLNESIYSLGGRLFSGWARAFVFAQIKQGISLETLLKAQDHAFTNLNKYLHGAYFFAFLHDQYGFKKVNRIFFNNSFASLDPFSFDKTLKHVFNKDLISLLKEYQEYYLPLAKEQKILPQKGLLSSQVSLPMNSDKQHIYFLISDTKSPAQLITMNKKTQQITKTTIKLPLGKLFYHQGDYMSSTRVKTKVATIESSLVKNDFKILDNYKSQEISDIRLNRVLSLDTRQTHNGHNRLLLNSKFYDNTHSSAIFSEQGDIYYFKQDKDIRTLYKNKQAVVSFKSYSAYPVEADKQGFYFIASVKHGSSLFVYKQGQGLFRISTGDRISYAKKINAHQFLVSEIHPHEYQYKIITIQHKKQKPLAYTYSFNKKDIFLKDQKLMLKNMPTKKTTKQKALKNIATNIKTTSLYEPSSLYKPWDHMFLYRMFFAVSPGLSFFQDFDILPWNELASKFYLLSSFELTDPLEFQDLHILSLSHPKHHKFFFKYFYKKYRPQWNISLSYENQTLDEKNYEYFKNFGFLQETKAAVLKKDFKPIHRTHRDRAINLAFTYPVFSEINNNIFISSNVKFGQKQFYKQASSLNLAFLYPKKSWNKYLQHGSSILADTKIAYRHAYLDHFKTKLQLAYDMLHLTAQSKKYQQLNGLFKAHVSKEIFRELFVTVNIKIQKTLYKNHQVKKADNLKPKALTYKTLDQHNLEHINSFAFKMQKVIQQSYYPLTMPFSLRRWTPLLGLKYLDVGSKTSELRSKFIIPFIGAEAELQMGFETSVFKVGVTLQSVFNSSKPSTPYMDFAFWTEASF